MATGWTLDGLNLRTLAYEVRTVDGWDTWPGLRGTNPEIPYRHGVRSTPRKWFAGRTVPLLLYMLDTDAAGNVTHPGGRAAHLRENIDSLFRLLTPGSLHDLRKTVTLPAGTPETRQALVEALHASEVQEAVAGGTVRQALIVFDMPHPFWRKLPQATHQEAGITTATRGFNLTTGGNAPIDSLQITFTATAAITNPRLEVDATGEYVQYGGTLSPGDVLVVDCATRTATINGVRATAGLTWGHAWWIELAANSTIPVTVSVSGASTFTVDLAWYDAYLTG